MPGKRTAACPHLGLLQDHATHMNFPSVANHCMNCRKPSRPSLAHQQDFCLTGAHTACPVYSAAGKADLPPELGGRPPLGMKWILALAAAVIVVALFFSLQRNRPASETSTSGQGQSVPLVIAPSLTAVPTQPPLPTATALPQPTPTPELPQPDLSLEAARTAPGTTQPFLIHVVQELETLDLIAANYNTTVPIIMAVNYKIQPPVWVDSPIVVPSGALSADGLPAFSVHEVLQESVSSQDLADELFADPAAIELYNGCAGPCQFTQGDWLLIPRTP